MITAALGGPKHSASVTTVYAFGATRTNVGVEAQANDNTWGAVALPSGTNAILIPATSALRVRLPGKACMMVDAYRSPPAAGGTIAFDEKQRTLTTTVQIAASNAKGKSGAFLTRRIEVQPLDTRR